VRDLSLTVVVGEQERACDSKASENEIMNRILDLEGFLKDEKDTLLSITSDMTRQYKQMQSKLQNNLNSLKTQRLMFEDEISICICFLMPRGEGEPDHGPDEGLRVSVEEEGRRDQ